MYVFVCVCVCVCVRVCVCVSMRVHAYVFCKAYEFTLSAEIKIISFMNFVDIHCV